MHITGLYAGLLALIGLFLSVKISALRMKTRVSIDAGGNVQLAEAIRRHGNFAEHVPLALLLMAIVETHGVEPRVLHALGLSLIVARVLHPLGIRHEFAPNPLRAAGAMLTFLVTLSAAAIAIWHAITAP